MSGNPELMQRALREAERAAGRTRPNPKVGCVIARGQHIIAVGYHARAGLPHAEVVALRKAGKLARGADVYVTLEPCDHHGRTPPCTEALIVAGVRRVFFGMRDPNPIVNGRGVRRLRAAGIGVQLGPLSEACERLNEEYSCYMRRGRPFVGVKIAESLDGRVATRTGQSRWITGEPARAYAHRLRNIYDAILVGVGTVLADDPLLTCRMRGGRDPVRIVLDSQARTPPRAAVLRQARRSTAPTFIMVGPRASRARCTALERAGARLIHCKASRRGIDLDDVFAKLHDAELLSVLVEGGPTVLGSFYDARLIDKVHAVIAPTLLGGEGARSAVGGLGAAKLSDALRLAVDTVERLGDDLLVVGYPRPTRGRR